MSLDSVVMYWRHEHWEDETVEIFRESALEASRWAGLAILVALCVCAGALGWLHAGHCDVLPDSGLMNTLLFGGIGVLSVAFLATLWWALSMLLWLSAVCGRMLLTRISTR